MLSFKYNAIIRCAAKCQHSCQNHTELTTIYFEIDLLVTCDVAEKSKVQCTSGTLMESYFIGSKVYLLIILRTFFYNVNVLKENSKLTCFKTICNLDWICGLWFWLRFHMSIFMRIITSEILLHRIRNIMYMRKECILVKTEW